MRTAVARVAAAASLCGLSYTLVSGVPDSVAILDEQRSRFSAMSTVEREQTFGLTIPTRMDIFDFYRRLIRPDDRFFVQVIDEGFGNASRATVVRSVARLYLAPAVEVEDPEDATVVLSYDSDPGLLPFSYSQQTRAGLQLIFVSRIAR